MLYLKDFIELVDIYFHTCRCYKVAIKIQTFKNVASFKIDSTQSAELKSFETPIFLCNFLASASVKIDVNKFLKITYIRWILSVYQQFIQKNVWLGNAIPVFCFHISMGKIEIFLSTRWMDRWMDEWK
jgi:hypothetical protein